MMLGASIRLTIFSGREQRGQSSGSASWTFLIKRAHVRLPGWAQASRLSEDGASREAAAPLFGARARRTWDRSPQLRISWCPASGIWVHRAARKSSAEQGYALAGSRIALGRPTHAADRADPSIISSRCYSLPASPARA